MSVDRQWTQRPPLTRDRNETLAHTDRISATDPADRMHSINGPMLAGVACGLVVGAALGLLLAPYDGRNTRQWIAAQGRHAGRRAAARLHGPEVIALIRERGVVGLVDVLHRRRTPKS